MMSGRRGSSNALTTLLISSALSSVWTIVQFHWQQQQQQQQEQQKQKHRVVVVPMRWQQQQQQKSTLEPPSSYSSTSGTLSLAELTNSPLPASIRCSSSDFLPVYDKQMHVGQHQPTTSQKPPLIPNIIHISYNHRCLPRDLYHAVQQWQRALPDHSLYFHDDDAVERLLVLQSNFPEFPHLHLVQHNCIRSKGAMRIDLWRLLVLYRYGGLYTDIDTLPGAGMFVTNVVGKDNHKNDTTKSNTNNSTTTLPDDFYYSPYKKSQDYLQNVYPHVSFVSGSDGRNRPTQWLFAMAPRHPIAYYAIHILLQNVLHMPSIKFPKVVATTGPEALREGYERYMKRAVQEWEKSYGKQQRRRRRRQRGDPSLHSSMLRLQDDVLASGLRHGGNRYFQNINGFPSSHQNNHSSPITHHYIQKLSHKYTHLFGQGNLGHTYNDIVDVEEYVEKVETQQQTEKNGTTTTTTTSIVVARNITRRERVERLSGVVHWQKELFWSRKYSNGNTNDKATNGGRSTENEKNDVDDVSCLEYLYAMTDNNS